MQANFKIKRFLPASRSPSRGTAGQITCTPFFRHWPAAGAPFRGRRGESQWFTARNLVYHNFIKPHE